MTGAIDLFKITSNPYVSKYLKLRVHLLEIQSNQLIVEGAKLTANCNLLCVLNSPLNLLYQMNSKLYNFQYTSTGWDRTRSMFSCSRLLKVKIKLLT